MAGSMILQIYAGPSPLSADAPVPILRLIQCVERELRNRRRRCAGRVIAGRMAVTEAASEIWEMEGVLDRLRDVAGCPTDRGEDLSEVIEGNGTHDL